MKRTIILFGLAILLALPVTACQSAATSNEAQTAAPVNDYKNPASRDGDAQTVTTKFSSRSYTPFTVQVGVPVKWIIQMDPKDLNGCNNEILIPKYDIAQKLAIGETIVEFTPTETGTIPYSCWMGMIRSKITVVDDLFADDLDDSIAQNPDAEQQIAAGTDNVNGTLVAENGQASAQSVPAENDPISALPAQTDNAQTTERPEQSDTAPAVPAVARAVLDGTKATVNLQVTEYGFKPGVAIVQRDVQTDFVFDVQQSSCATAVMFPQLSQYVDLTKSNTVTVTPTENFNIACVTALYGITVLVVDDINSPKAEAIAQDVLDNPSTYAYQGSSCCDTGL